MVRGLHHESASNCTGILALACCMQNKGFAWVDNCNFWVSQWN
jgi:hypothetical protein